MNVNENLLTANLRTPMTGSNPMVDVEEDLANKPEYGLNSWFIIGHFTDRGHTISYLFHFMIMKVPVLGTKYVSVVSVTDHTTGYYYGEDKMYSAKDVTLDENGFGITMPNGYMRGTWDRMEFGFSMPDATVEGVGVCYGLPIYSKRTGAFQLLDMYVHQYSIPHMSTTGTMTLKDERYSIRADSWFDRQWQDQNMKNVLRWSWIAVYLDNGDVLSVFDCDVPSHQQHWVTILRADGTLDYAEIEPFENGMNAYWLSERTDQYYPTRITVRIPSEDAVLTFAPDPKEQEIASVMKQLHKYEASCDVTGTYHGKEIGGHACIELIGSWKHFK
ncbi:lipocalin family protein [Bifidobacterium eulemuris]|uniref:Mucin-1 (Muc-1) n=1 Tax=Bifidobacterium eulemuris TaxID=1765219 RepID=A0A261G809_9BIFI|nr:lipocalin family protein [Bifidobacterium eulemuris]OZG67544.1 mucin-1 (muc-1) [Bifidobacterium eulemuris]QOL31080.1 hypothetical protein BE0216_00305 [Bifidobacterium eulemuris]